VEEEQGDDDDEEEVSSSSVLIWVLPDSPRLATIPFSE
jgi:hypothetical protein